MELNSYRTDTSLPFYPLDHHHGPSMKLISFLTFGTVHKIKGRRESNLGRHYLWAKLPPSKYSIGQLCLTNAARRTMQRRKGEKFPKVIGERSFLGIETESSRGKKWNGRKTWTLQRLKQTFSFSPTRWISLELVPAIDLVLVSCLSCELMLSGFATSWLLAFGWKDYGLSGLVL